jgi:hypothetical protein
VGKHIFGELAHGEHGKQGRDDECKTGFILKETHKEPQIFFLPILQFNGSCYQANDSPLLIVGSLSSFVDIFFPIFSLIS